MADVDDDGFLLVTLVPIDEEVDEERPPSAAGAYVGQILAGRYELTKRIGSGGAGEVYRARVLAGGPDVAVKVMRPRIAKSPDNVRRFRREARAAALLDHPNVIRVIELAQDPVGTFFIVMEMLEGTSLAEWVVNFSGVPPLADVRSIFLPLLDAFEAAHAKGIVHRDLKGENVFLRRMPDGTRRVTVLDFGLARMSDPSEEGGTLTKPDALGGTPEYMSPEQCRSLRVGPGTDLYALGCLLTELLQKRTPFEGGAPMEVMAKQMFMAPPELDRPDGAEPVPEALDALRRALLAKTEEARPPDVATVRALFLAALPEGNESPPVAPPVPPEAPPSVGSESLGAKVKRLFKGRS